MVHTFSVLDGYFLLDTDSGSLFQIDEAAYIAAKKILGEEIPKNSISAVEIQKAEEELNKLKDDGVLFSEFENSNPLFFDGNIKALCLNITHKCNFRCKYCFAVDGSYGEAAEDMPLETAKRAIDFLLYKSGRRRNLEVDFFGGEPLINFDTVKKTVEYARAKEKEFNKNFRFTLTTNALILNDEIIDFLNQNMSNVVLSIDGRESVHDYARCDCWGGKTFERVLKNSKMFKEKRQGEYYVRGTFTSKNLDFAADVLSLNDDGFDQISLEPVVLPESHEMAIKKEDLDIIKGQYEILSKEYLKRRKTDEKWFNFFHFMFNLEGGPCEKKRVTACGAGNEYLAIAPNGNIYPCHQFDGNAKFVMGNVLDGFDIDEEMRHKFQSVNIYSKPQCKSCWAKYYCSGGCAANSYNFSGDINKPYEITCELMKMRIEYAIAVNVLEKNE